MYTPKNACILLYIAHYMLICILVVYFKCLHLFVVVNYQLHTMRILALYLEYTNLFTVV